MKASDIASGHGVVGEINGRPVAVYNAGDRLVVLENICTHMGCQTDWNDSGDSWDCPCHGSRYHPDGSVMLGPAAQPLPRLQYRLENGEIALD